MWLNFGLIVLSLLLVGLKFCLLQFQDDQEFVRQLIPLKFSSYICEWFRVSKLLWIKLILVFKSIVWRRVLPRGWCPLRPFHVPLGSRAVSRSGQIEVVSLVFVWIHELYCIVLSVLVLVCCFVFVFCISFSVFAVVTFGVVLFVP